MVDVDREITLVWLPVVVFYASLVVRRSTIVRMHSGSHGSLRVLQLFRDGLEKMSWPYCKSIANTLQNSMLQSSA